MKRVIQILAAAALVVGLCLSSAHARKLIVACDTAFKPFEFKQDGKYVGFDIDLWAAIAKDLGVEYDLQPMAFNGIIPALQTGNVDVGIAGMTIKSKRAEVVDFSYPYYRSGLLLLVRSDNTDIKSVEDLKDKVVATKLGTSSVDFLKGYETGKVSLFQDQDASFMELRTGGADAVLFDAPVVQNYLNTAGKGAVKVVGPLYQGQYYGIAFPMGSELRNKVNISLLKLIESGEYAKLYKKWFGTEPK